MELIKVLLMMRSGDLISIKVIRPLDEYQQIRALLDDGVECLCGSVRRCVDQKEMT